MFMSHASADQQEPTNRELLEAIQSMSTHMDERLDRVEHDVSGLKQDVAELKHDVSGLKQDVAELKHDVSGLKQDVAELKHDVSGLKQELTHVKNDVITHVDYFVTLHQTHDIELLSVRKRCDRMEDFMVPAGKKLGIAFEQT
jgi:archaellum component FlaC